MFKRSLILLCLFLTLSSPAWGGGLLIGSGVQADTAPTNFLLDSRCMSAYFMNSDGSTGETDQKDGDDSLTVSSEDTIDREADVYSGFSGYSRRFTFADTDYLTGASTGDNSIYGSNARITIVAKIKVASTSSGVSQSVVSKYNATAATRSYLIEIKGGTSNTFQIAMYLSADGGSTNKVSGVTTNYFNPNTWYSIALVYDDIDVKIYVNGVLEGTYAYTMGLYNSSAAFMIGYNSGNTGTYSGWIDEVGVFNSDLSADEILSIHTNGLDGSKGAND